jgi:autotransporter-associated beta strand protein
MTAPNATRQYHRIGFIILLTSIMIAIMVSPAASLTWTGAANGNWGDGGNWVGGAPPGAGDNITYNGSSTGTLAQSNNLGNFNVAGININVGTPGDVTISGDPFTLTSHISCNVGVPNITINNNLTLGASLNLSSYSANQATINGNIDNGGNNFSYLANVAGGIFNFNGSMSGAGGFSCMSNNGGTCNISAAQNHTALTRIQGSNVTLRLSGAGGLPDNGYVLLNDPGSAFDLNGVSDTIGSLAGSGPVTLGGATLTLGGDNSASMNVSGVISENGSIVKEGTGTLLLAGANTFNGSLTINNGTVRISGAAERIPDNTAVILNAGTFATGGYEETIGSLSGAAVTVVQLGGTATLTTGGNNASTTYAGTMIYGGSLTKEGTGTFTLSGNNTYTGTTTVSAGTLRLGADERLSNASSMTVASGATFDLNGFNETIRALNGAGTVTTGAGTLTINTALNPGTSPGVITLGNVDLSTATLNIEIDGTNPGTGYDQITATGSVTLGGNLNLTATHSPTAGDTFVIINKTSPGAVAGTFAGLNEGATISAGGTNYRISYAGGVGSNDVVLTAMASGGGGGSTPDPDPAPAPPVPQGSGPNPTGSLDGSQLTWPYVKGARYYRIYRADCPLCPRKEIGRTKENSFVDNTAIPGQPYTYWLRAENGDGPGVYSNWMAAWRYEQNPGRAGDFNGDGVMDLLWWDRATGQVFIWFMSGGQVTGVSSPMDGMDVSQWLLIGTGDFNGDGACDLLWWKPESGEIVFWYMQPGISTASAPFQATSDPISQNMPSHAALSYPGDLNGDGLTDLLWRDYAGGDVLIWLMGADGKPFLTGPPVPADETITKGERPGLSGTLQWQVAGLADADGDGKADVFWQDERNNRLVTWLMDGVAITQAIDETKGLDTVWRLAGLGDLNGDGQADIVWRSDASGELKAWLMQAGKFLEERAIVEGSDEATQWQVKAVGDFCSPGCDDIYCKHSESSAAKIVTLDGQEFAPSVE